MTELTAPDGHRFGVHEVRPAGARAAVVVVQEIFGLNHHIRSVVERYAALGYHAVAPALFDRLERGVELAYDPDGIARGRELAARLGVDAPMADLAATVAAVAPTGPVAVVGFCFGGSLAWRAAHELGVSAAVGYYGGQIHQMIGLRPRVPTMLHFGEVDPAIPLADVEAVAEAHPGVEVHVHVGARHGFACDERSSFDPVSAAVAFGRTVEFLVASGVRP